MLYVLGSVSEIIHRTLDMGVGKDRRGSGQIERTLFWEAFQDVC